MTSTLPPPTTHIPRLQQRLQEEGKREGKKQQNNKSKREEEGGRQKKVVPTHVSPPDARTNVLRLQYVYRPHPNKKSSDDE